MRPGVLWTAARHKIPMLAGDAQQSRLSPGGDARAAAVELPQPGRQYRQRSGADRHQHHESRTSSITSSPKSMGWWAKGPIKDPAELGPGDQGSGRRGQIRPAGAGQCLDPTALRRIRSMRFVRVIWRWRLFAAGCAVRSRRRADAASAENGKTAFVQHGCWQCHGFEGPGLGRHQRRQGHRRYASCRSMRSRPTCAQPTARCRHSAPRSCPTPISPTSTPIWSRGRSRRPVRTFRCSTPTIHAAARHGIEEQRIGYSRRHTRDRPPRRDDDDRQRSDAARRLLQSDRPSRGVVAASPRPGRRRHQFPHYLDITRTAERGKFDMVFLGRQSRRAAGAYGGAEPLGAIYRQFRAADAARRRSPPTPAISASWPPPRPATTSRSTSRANSRRSII